MRIVGDDERQLKLPGELRELRIQPAELLLPVLLQFDVVASGEHVAVPAGRLARVVVTAIRERRHQLARGAGGEHDEPLAVRREQLAVHARAVVEALQVRGGRELDQVAVAGLVLCQQREVEGAALLRIALRPAPRRNVALQAEDRLHVARARRFVELDHAVERAVAGDRERVLSEVLRAIEERRDLAEPVQQRELGVGVKVDEHRTRRNWLCAHAGTRTGVRLGFPQTDRSRRGCQILRRCGTLWNAVKRRRGDALSSILAMP